MATRPAKKSSLLPGESDSSGADRSDARDARAPLFDALRQPIERMSSTRINSWLGLAADSSVSIFLLYAGLGLAALQPISALYVILAGIVAFSFVEYCLHRWLFHGSAPMFERGHRHHHEEPRGYDSLPFFLPPLAILAFAELLGLAVAKGPALLFVGGFAAGYFAYGLSHTFIHRLRFQNTLVRRWAAAHHIHHSHPDRNFGVTTPLWDILLRTRYERHKRNVSA
jgi:sterol desaturase/sphingolipid hydroxylase (fatty acid hydroxylase superfamily)